MANFTLTWTPNINSNVSEQIAEYRQKSIGGAFIDTGFVPAVPLSIAANTTSISGLLDNVVYEFRIANNCTFYSRIYHEVIEKIKFACVTPTETHTSTSIIATVFSLPTDIIKVQFTLFNSDATTVIQGPIIVNTSAGACSNLFGSLTPDTTYIVKVELIAIVNGIEITSNLNTCQISVTTNITGDEFLINSIDSILINGTDNLTI